MSQTPLLPAPGNFQSIFDTALNQYKKMTKNDLVAHQLTAQLESCTSPSAILAVLNEHYGVQQFVQSQTDSERPKQWLNATRRQVIHPHPTSIFPDFFASERDFYWHWCLRCGE